MKTRRPQKTSPSEFTRRVLMVARSIPPGRVATYGDLARLAGRPGAARAVGNIMREGGQPGVPYHRVIAAGGRAGGYGGNEALKHELLRREGLTVIGGRVRRFAAVRWPQPGERTGARRDDARSAKSR